MRAEEFLAIAYNRGLRPTLVADLTGDRRIEWLGGRLTPAMQRALPFHAAALEELVAAGYVPPTVGTAAASAPDPTHAYPDRTEPLRGPYAYDREAEYALRHLYASGCGIFPVLGSKNAAVRYEVRIAKGVNRDIAQDAVRSVRPLRDRIVAHVSLTPSSVCAEKGFESAGRWGLEFRVRDRPDGDCLRVWKQLYEVSEFPHPFMIVPASRFDAWREWGAVHWRDLWGRHEADEDGIPRWVRWGE